MSSAVSTCSLLLLFEVSSLLTLSPPLDIVAKQFGYTLETHPLVNDGGYILGVHRLLKQTEKAASINRPPVLLVHGLGQSSDTLLNRNWHYGYFLVNNGYDVWIHNYRGNIYSRKHTTLNPDSEAFHNFTMTDLGRDLPHTIDYILEKTGRKTLSYVGCSMGGELFWALGSFYPEYMAKISVSVGVGVIGYPLDTTQSNFRDALFFIETVVKRFGKPEIYNPFPVIGPILNSFCSGSGWHGPPLCKLFATMVDSLLAGCDLECLVNLVDVGTSSVSEKVLQHYFQMIKASKLQEFDYGEQTNERLYGSKTPQMYDVTKITCPMFFICGDADRMATLTEVENLAAKLPTRPTIKVFKGYSHTNLYMNEKTVKIVLNELLTILNGYNVSKIPQ